MPLILRINLWVLILLAACSPAAQTTQQPVAAAAELADTMHNFEFLANQKPQSLLDLPESQDGDIILGNGFYEADFKSYCLQPGTPDPSSRDAYMMGPLSGNRRDIVETILRNSLKKPHLEQKNIQLLLWSVVSRSNFNSLSFPVQSTAAQLLTPKQVFELRGGVMGVVKTVAAVMPDSGPFHEMNQLFDLGASSYEVYERVAVLREPSVIRRPDYKRDQWYKQEGGYFVRYFPTSYQKVKIQVYVPGGTVDSTGKRAGSYLLFDPVNMMAIPANSNAQRLGIGAPMVDIFRKIIEIEKDAGRNRKPVEVPKPKQENPKNPKTGI
jgi:hypothetical protein